MHIIHGQFKKKKLLMPPPTLTRPTSQSIKESIFNILRHRYDFDFEGKNVLDGCCGSGSIGIEMMSLGAQAIFVDESVKALDIVQKNLHAIEKKAPLLCCDILKIRTNPSDPMDLIFLDPPYHKKIIPDILTSLTQRHWINDSTLCVLEAQEEYMLDRGCIKEYGQTAVSFGFFKT
jgi:16S rRNA (guanine966-N2)-methyltransferase